MKWQDERTHIGIQQRLKQCEVQIDNGNADDGTNKYRICVRIMFYTKEPPVWNTTIETPEKKECEEKKKSTRFSILSALCAEKSSRRGAKEHRVSFTLIASAATKWMRERTACIFKHTRKERKRQTVSQINWQFQT